MAFLDRFLKVSALLDDEGEDVLKTVSFKPMDISFYREDGLEDGVLFVYLRHGEFIKVPMSIREFESRLGDRAGRFIDVWSVVIPYVETEDDEEEVSVEELAEIRVRTSFNPFHIVHFREDAVVADRIGVSFALGETLAVDIAFADFEIMLAAFPHY